VFSDRKQFDPVLPTCVFSARALLSCKCSSVLWPILSNTHRPREHATNLPLGLCTVCRPDSTLPCLLRHRPHRCGPRRRHSDWTEIFLLDRAYALRNRNNTLARVRVLCLCYVRPCLKSEGGVLVTDNSERSHTSATSTSFTKCPGRTQTWSAPGSSSESTRVCCITCAQILTFSLKHPLSDTGWFPHEPGHHTRPLHLYGRQPDDPQARAEHFPRPSTYRRRRQRRPAYMAALGVPVHSRRARKPRHRACAFHGGPVTRRGSCGCLSYARPHRSFPGRGTHMRAQ
jgi:hypothetical protein